MIVLEANYSKKLGLPGYSSHQYSVSIKTELSDISQVQAESTRLYALLQSSVDREIQETGFLPTQNGNGNGHPNGNGHTNGNSDVWKCSDKQKKLILDIVEKNHLEKSEVEALARERFNTPVKMLDKMQASNFIDELFEKYGGKENGNGNRRYSNRNYGKAPR
jgi:hypothetical protein